VIRCLVGVEEVEEEVELRRGRYVRVGRNVTDEGPGNGVAATIEVRRQSGALLVVMVAGVLSYGIHEFQEVGWLPGAEGHAFDVSAAIPPDSWYGTLLRGTIGFTPNMT
jgi:hypothetical protein